MPEVTNRAPVLPVNHQRALSTQQQARVRRKASIPHEFDVSGLRWSDGYTHLFIPKGSLVEQTWYGFGEPVFVDADGDYYAALHHEARRILRAIRLCMFDPQCLLEASEYVLNDARFDGGSGMYVVSHHRLGTIASDSAEKLAFQLATMLDALDRQEARR